MSTKADLEAEILRLKGVIKEQEKAVSKLCHDRGVDVTLPFREHGMSHGPFLMVTGSDRDERMLDSKILRVLWEVINAHGIPHGHGECPGAFSGSELSPVRGEGYDSGKQFVIPSVAAALIADLLNGVADYAAACYADGYARGIDHTRQLASGEMSAADFEDAAVREKAKTVQKHKRYAIRKYSSR